MTISHLLEDFGSRKPEPDRRTALGEEEIEDIRLGAFEQGYSAGWEDATAAQTKDNQRISAALSASLEDLSFTYHEAVNQMTLALEPMFRTLIAAVLPEMMARTFGDHILAQIRLLAQNQLQGPVQLRLPPGSAAAVRPLLSSELTIPVELTEDPALESGQARLQIAGEAREIDCAALIRSFGEAVDAFFYQTSKDIQNG